MEHAKSPMTHKRPTNEIVWEALSSLCAQVLEDMDIIAAKQSELGTIYRLSRIQTMLGFLVATGHITIEEYDGAMANIAEVLKRTPDETPEVG